MKQKSPRKLSKALVKAIKNKDFDGVKAAVEEGANPDVIPKDILESFNDFMGFSTKSPLKLAIDKGTPEIVSYLIDKSKLSEIDYLFFYARNQKQGLDMNPLMYAVYKNKPDFVETIAKHKKTTSPQYGGAGKHRSTMGFAREQGYGNILEILKEARLLSILRNNDQASRNILKSFNDLYSTPAKKMRELSAQDPEFRIALENFKSNLSEIINKLPDTKELETPVERVTRLSKKLPKKIK